MGARRKGVVVVPLVVESCIPRRQPRVSRAEMHGGASRKRAGSDSVLVRACTLSGVVMSASLLLGGGGRGGTSS